jgi:hypothetical protein
MGFISFIQEREEKERVRKDSVHGQERLGAPCR